jgi:DNA-binding MurR/RpiR family transcriptional regulator
MGFSAYREFQHYLHELSIAQATPLDLMKMTSTEDSDIPAHLREVVNRDLKNLQILRQGLDFGRIAGLAKKLYDARRILIMGGDLARNLAGFLQYNLMLLGLPVFTALTAGEAVHATRAVSKGDLVIAISFRRGLRQTVEGLQQARNNGAYCVGITDTYISPIARFSNECFLASIDSPSFGGSYAAPMTLLNVLIVACAHYRRDRTLALLKKAEKEQRTGFRWYSED